jgi:hypothetical protein
MGSAGQSPARAWFHPAWHRTSRTMEESTPDAISAEQPSDAPPNDALRALVGVFIVLDVFTIPLVAGVAEGGYVGGLLAAAGMSVLVAQFALLAVWGVFGSLPLILRLPASILVATLLYLATSLGTLGVRMNSEEVQVLLCSTMLVPLMVLVLQSPIWLVRAFLDWTRFGRNRNELIESRASRQFRLQDMFVVTAVVAVSLGLAQAFARSMPTPGSEEAGFILMIICLYFAGLATVLSFFLVLPCLTACLVVENANSGRWALVLYAAVLTIGLTVLFSFAGPPGEILVMFFFSIATVVSVSLLVVATTFSVVRGAGYRLVRRRRLPEPSHREGCPFAVARELVEVDAADDPFTEEASGEEPITRGDPFAS